MSANDTNKGLEDVDSGTIQFVDHFIPQLPAGLYSLSTSHQVGSKDGSIHEPEPFTSEKSFYVQGERFVLNPGEVVSSFPPDGCDGEYSNVLPHVVLGRKTLAWERPLANNLSTSDGRSWLAVLVFDEDDPCPALVNRTIADLQSTADFTSYFQPGDLPKELEPGQTFGSPCQTIDVPFALFNQIAPTYDDLLFTAHAREITTNAKGPGGTQTTSYCVVIANRLPTAGKKSTAHLVSLENLGSYLPTAQNAGSLTTAIRLVSLAHWSFFSVKLEKSFMDLINAAGQPPVKFEMPNPDPVTGQTAPPALADALKMGYVAMTHYLREGTQTVSWYRGPFLPFAQPLTMAPPFPSADSVLRYDPTTGFFDASYAAAWQLGQLLGLQNKKFAVALTEWKRQNQMATIQALEQQVIQEQYGQIFSPPTAGLTPNAVLSQSMQFIKKVLAPPST